MVSKRELWERMNRMEGNVMELNARLTRLMDFLGCAELPADRRIVKKQSDEYLSWERAQLEGLQRLQNIRPYGYHQ